MLRRMRRLSLFALLILAAGCGSTHGMQPAAAPQPQTVAPVERMTALEVDPAWMQFVQANYQKRVREILIDNPDSAVFPPGKPTVEAAYLPSSGTYLTAQGPVQYRDATGRLRDGIYFVRWQTPGRASGANVRWQPGPVSISQEATPPTTTINPSAPITQ